MARYIHSGLGPSKSLLSQPIGIFGTGVGGIINAHVLLQDGFEDITLISHDASVGGVWSRDKVYDGLRTNNVHGEYRFSAKPMKSPPKEPGSDQHLTGKGICEYLEEYSEEYLDRNKVKFVFRTDIVKAWRDDHGRWQVETKNLDDGNTKTLSFSKIIVATGGAHTPNIPKYLDPSEARDVGFHGRIFHSSEYAKEQASLVDFETQPNGRRCVVIGGGKSGQDLATLMTARGYEVTLVYEQLDFFFATPKPLPDYIRKSRFMSILSPHRKLETRLERFLHTTKVGGAIVQFIWGKMMEGSFSACSIPAGSPLRLTPHAFWCGRGNDEGVPRPDGFQALVNNGRIKVAAPTRAVGYAGQNVLLNNGERIPAEVVVLATGYTSSWTMFDEKMAEELGLSPYQRTSEFNDKWNYTSLKSPPPSHPERDTRTRAIYRGIVPAKNILQEDFAIAGGMYTVNAGHTMELAAHWTSSYFLGDRMRLPASPEEAIADAEEMADFARLRFPEIAFWKQGSEGLTPDSWTWPQAGDELLEDMYLSSCRSGGNSFNWFLKKIDVEELASLGDERKQKRGLGAGMIS